MTLGELVMKTTGLRNSSTVYVVTDGMVQDIKNVEIDEDGDILIAVDEDDEDYSDDFEDEL